MATGLSAACALRHAFMLAKMVAGVDRVARPGWFWDWSKRIGDAAPPWLRMLPCVLAQAYIQLLYFTLLDQIASGSPLKPVRWCGASRSTIRAFPADARRE